MGIGFTAVLMIALTIFLSSCTPSKFETPKNATAADVPIINKVTKENYMNGQQFCEKYVNTESPISKETGKWIDVPFSYAVSAEKKSVKIYVYTKRAFDPKLPSYIVVDGGPGQNTHGADDLVESGFNEIRFDQRGVGCSAPSTWDEYSDPSLYSSMNTARDIDEVRKSYGVKTISLYGVSYGTVPATVYAHQFEKNVQALVLEGVLGKVENLSRYTFEVEKYNLVLASLNPAQKAAFSDIMYGDDDEKKFVVMYFLGSARYQDGGYRIVRDVYFKKLFPESGGTENDVFSRGLVAILKNQNPFLTAQHPGAVDENVLKRFYCKELGGFSKDKFALEYSRSQGFFETAVAGKKKWTEDCLELGINRSMENLYDERDYTTSVPVYYLQGSHDVATVADGALSHWKHVPQSKSYFLLSLKGGHNPALSKLRSADDEISRLHKELFKVTLGAQPLTMDFVRKLNASITNSVDKEEKMFTYNTWELYSGGKANTANIEDEFTGLRRLSQSK